MEVENMDTTQAQEPSQPEKTYTVVWTYVANHSDHPTIVRARSPEEAIKKVSFYNPDTVNFLVIEGLPVLETARNVEVMDGVYLKRRVDYRDSAEEIRTTLEMDGIASIDKSLLRDLYEAEEEDAEKATPAHTWGDQELTEALEEIAKDELGDDGPAAPDMSKMVRLPDGADEGPNGESVWSAGDGFKYYDPEEGIETWNADPYFPLISPEENAGPGDKEPEFARRLDDDAC